MPRPGPGAALPGPRHGAAEPPARRAQPEPAARRAAHGEPDRQHRRRPRGALRPAHLADRDAGAAGGRRRRGAAAPDRDRGRAVLQVRALARRVLLEVPQRGALRAVGHRCDRASHPAGAHRAQARLLPARPRPRARRPHGPARPLLRRVQSGCGHPRDHPRDIRGLGRRLSLDLSRQLDRGHGPERLLRGRAPRRPRQRDLGVQRGQQRRLDDRPASLQARAAALPEGAARAAGSARAHASASASGSSPPPPTPPPTV